MCVFECFSLVMAQCQGPDEIVRGEKMKHSWPDVPTPTQEHAANDCII